MHLPELISACVAAGVLPASEPDMNGCYEFRFDDQLTVGISVRDGAGAAAVIGSSVMLRGIVLDALPAGEAEAAELLGRLLRWNFPRLRFQEDALALEPDGAVVLWRPIAAEEMEPGRFTTCLEGFLNSLEFWVGAARQDTGTSMGQRELAGLPSHYSMIFP